MAIILLYFLDFDAMITYLLSCVIFIYHVLDKCNIPDIFVAIFTLAIYLIQPNGIRKKSSHLCILLVITHQPPSGSGTAPLQEYRRDIPPERTPENPSYPQKVYLEKLRLWYRNANVEDLMIDPLIAGRAYGRASKLAMACRVPRPDGTMDIGTQHW